MVDTNFEKWGWQTIKLHHKSSKVYFTYYTKFQEKMQNINVAYVGCF